MGAADIGVDGIIGHGKVGLGEHALDFDISDNGFHAILPASAPKQPANTRRYALGDILKVIARGKFQRRGDAPGTEMGGDGFGFAAHRFQHGVARPGFAVAEGKVETVPGGAAACGRRGSPAGRDTRESRTCWRRGRICPFDRAPRWQRGRRANNLRGRATPAKRAAAPPLWGVCFPSAGAAIAPRRRKRAVPRPSAGAGHGEKIALPSQSRTRRRACAPGRPRGLRAALRHVLRGAEAEQRRGGRGGIDLRAQVFRGKNRHSPSPPFLSGVTAIIAHPLKAADEDRPLRGGGQSMRAFYQR